MQFDEVLSTWNEFFRREEIRFALIGGMAMKAWGRVRLTKDIDFAVDRADQARVVEFAESLGYEALHVSEAFSNHVHEETRFGRIDFMYVAGETANRIFAASRTMPVLGDAALPVASAEHLAMMKAMAMKNFPHRALFEGEDVRSLLNVPGVDRSAIREYFSSQGLLDSSMPLKKPVEPLDTFALDVPITAADNEALWRARQLNDMDPHEYLQFLLAFTKDLPADRHIIEVEPFEL